MRALVAAWEGGVAAWPPTCSGEAAMGPLLYWGPKAELPRLWRYGSAVVAVPLRGCLAPAVPGREETKGRGPLQLRGGGGGHWSLPPPPRPLPLMKLPKAGPTDSIAGESDLTHNLGTSGPPQCSPQKAALNRFQWEPIPSRLTGPFSSPPPPHHQQFTPAEGPPSPGVATDHIPNSAMAHAVRGVPKRALWRAVAHGSRDADERQTAQTEGL